jgi:hypothetical protein
MEHRCGRGNVDVHDVWLEFFLEPDNLSQDPGPSLALPFSQCFMKREPVHVGAVMNFMRFHSLTVLRGNYDDVESSPDKPCHQLRGEPFDAPDVWPVSVGPPQQSYALPY